MPIYAIQHVPFETLGNITQWRADIQYIRTFQRDSYPKIDEVELLIILGGPMSANDQTEEMKAEKQFIHLALEKEIPILGICLGCQLLAQLLGGKVYAGAEKEVGWQEIEKEPMGKLPDALSFLPTRFKVFQWHGETYTLPSTALTLYHSQEISEQAFLYNERVLGLQFHLEMTKDTVQTLVAADEDYLTEGPYIQRKEQILTESIPAENKEIMFQLLNYLYTKKQNKSTAN